MVLFAIIVIFDHYYKFCDVFKVKFERIRNIPKPNVIVNMYESNPTAISPPPPGNPRAFDLTLPLYRREFDGWSGI
jgi:hypothetical protein